MIDRFRKIMAVAAVTGLVAALAAGCGSTDIKDGEQTPAAASETKEPSSDDVASGDAADVDTSNADAVSGAGAEYHSDLIVKKLDDYDIKNMRGVDVSSYLAIMDAFDMENKNIENDDEKKGFRDRDGKLLDRQGFFDLLADAGVNYIRTRVWNDPADSEGRGYGGGNNTAARAAEIAAYATKAGMGNLIDLHMSDFWADPAKQMSPKEWKKYNIDKKIKAVSKFVTDALTEIESKGGIVDMVQIGNEINTGFAGETEQVGINKLLDAGCDAAHEYGYSDTHIANISAVETTGEYFGFGENNIYTVIHLTEPQTEGAQLRYASQLAAFDGGNGVSYDIFASSYYPYWHGTTENLTKVLSAIAERYDKYVLAVETSWATRLDDGDGQPNTVSVEKNSTDMPFRFTVQGQADEIRAVASAVNDVDVTLTSGDRAGLGICYWEPAWIPVNNISELEGSEYKKALKANKKLWERTGSGWASSYAKQYDPDDAGKYYGGSAVDNQAWFDYDGSPLSTLDIYRYLIGGSDAEKRPDGGYVETVEVVSGGEITMPSEAKVIYNDGTEENMPVNWDEADISAIDTSKEGTYTVHGNFTNDTSFDLICPVIVAASDFMDGHDGDFEKDPSDWTISGEGIKQEFEDAKNNAVSGRGYINFWSESGVKGSLTSQTVTIDTPGTYAASITCHGDVLVGSEKKEKVMLIVKTGDGRTMRSDKIISDGWQNYITTTVPGIKITDDMIKNKENTITLTISVKLGGGRWMAIDDASITAEE
ncbi:MAG: glycosyl hydrolase 53 family protein [Eubacterium sp.]|nr:glycosyl hydrolase 53 family protein [Eubacterium sp.]